MFLFYIIGVKSKIRPSSDYREDAYSRHLQLQRIDACKQDYRSSSFLVLSELISELRRSGQDDQERVCRCTAPMQ